MDCRECKNWNSCPCGERGHKNKTSIGFSSGMCAEALRVGKNPWCKFVLLLRVIKNSTFIGKLWWDIREYYQVLMLEIRKRKNK